MSGCPTVTGDWRGTTGGESPTPRRNVRVCDPQPSYYDDILRVRVEDITPVDGGFEWTAGVAQPGEDWTYDWSQEGRSRFNTVYTEVTFRAFALDGTELVARDLGEFAAGVSETFRVETDQFPDIVTATIAGVETGYEGRCERARTGADIRGFAGRHDDDWSPPWKWEPEFRRSGTPPTDAGEHRWHPHGTLPVGEMPPLSRNWYQQTLCLQRIVAGHDEDHAALSVLPNGERRLARNDTYQFELYRYHWQAPHPDERPEPAAVPELLRDAWHETDWESMGEGEGPNIYKIVRNLTREEYKRVYATLEGEETPTTPSFGRESAENHYPGHCREGNAHAYYRFQVRGDPSALTLSYTWTGPQLELGGTTPSV